MSYSNHSHAATAYREREVLTASPARLVVIVFDHVLANLHRARVAGDVKNLEVRLDALTRARAGVMELLTTLDADKGGALGTNLRAIYVFVLTQLLEESRKPDAQRHAKITAMIAELREAFATIADAPRVSAA